MTETEKQKTVVACEVLVPELRTVLADHPEIRVVSLPAALHTDLKRLDQELDCRLSTCTSSGPDENDLCVLFGRECSPSVDQLTDKHGAVRIQAGNCLDALLGEHRKEAEDEGAFVITPGWIRAWPAIMEAMGWDEVDSRLNLGRYDKAALFDTGVEPQLTEEEILWFFEVSGLYVEMRSIELHFFKDLVSRCLHLADT